MWLAKKIHIFFGVFFEQNRSNFFAPIFLNQKFCGLDARAYGYVQTFPKNHFFELRALQNGYFYRKFKMDFSGIVIFNEKV